MAHTEAQFAKFEAILTEVDTSLANDRRRQFAITRTYQIDYSHKVETIINAINALFDNCDLSTKVRILKTIDTKLNCSGGIILCSVTKYFNLTINDDVDLVHPYIALGLLEQTFHRQAEPIVLDPHMAVQWINRHVWTALESMPPEENTPVNLWMDVIRIVDAIPMDLRHAIVRSFFNLSWTLLRNRRHHLTSCFGIAIIPYIANFADIGLLNIDLVGQSAYDRIDRSVRSRLIYWIDQMVYVDCNRMCGNMVDWNSAGGDTRRVWTIFPNNTEHARVMKWYQHVIVTIDARIRDAVWTKLNADWDGNDDFSNSILHNYVYWARIWKLLFPDRQRPPPLIQFLRMTKQGTDDAPTTQLLLEIFTNDIIIKPYLMDSHLTAFVGCMKRVLSSEQDITLQDMCYLALVLSLCRSDHTVVRGFKEKGPQPISVFCPKDFDDVPLAIRVLHRFDCFMLCLGNEGHCDFSHDTILEMLSQWLNRKMTAVNTAVYANDLVIPCLKMYAPVLKPLQETQTDVLTSMIQHHVRTWHSIWRINISETVEFICTYYFLHEQLVLFISTNNHQLSVETSKRMAHTVLSNILSKVLKEDQMWSPSYHTLFTSTYNDDLDASTISKTSNGYDLDMKLGDWVLE